MYYSFKKLIRQLLKFHDKDVMLIIFMVLKFLKIVWH